MSAGVLRSRGVTASGRVGLLRLGTAEEAILAELNHSGGPVPRRALVRAVYVRGDARRAAAATQTRFDDDAVVPEGRARQHAESTLSRALRSLERKGLIVRRYNGPTRQTLVSVTDPPAPPAWEREARFEERFAARCDAVSAELAELARRARRRAIQLRGERRSSSTSRERGSDVAYGMHLMSVKVPTPEGANGG